MCTHLTMDRERVSHSRKANATWTIDSLWGHPEHQSGEEHGHDTEEERELLPSSNDLRRMPRSRELRQPSLNLYSAQMDAATNRVNHDTFKNPRQGRLVHTLNLNFCISRSKFSARSSPAGVFILLIASSARALIRSLCFVRVRWIRSMRASKNVSRVSTQGTRRHHKPPHIRHKTCQTQTGLTKQCKSARPISHLVFSDETFEGRGKVTKWDRIWGSGRARRIIIVGAHGCINHCGGVAVESGQRKCPRCGALPCPERVAEGDLRHVSNYTQAPDPAQEISEAARGPTSH